jgi:hypothetical protein
MGNYVSNIVTASSELDNIVTTVTETISSLSKQVNELMEFKNELEKKQHIRYLIVYKLYNQNSTKIEFNIQKKNIQIQHYENFCKIKYYPSTLDQTIVDKLNINVLDIDAVINLLKQICPQYESNTVEEVKTKLLLLMNQYQPNN